MHNEHKTAAAGILLLLAGIFAATTVPSLVFACSLLPEKRTEAEQIRDADLILKGVVGKTIVTESDYKNSRQYIHELETQLTVTKTYKGPADLSTITVHVSASPETRCPFVDFRTQNGKEVTIKLRVDPKTKRLFADLRPEIKDTAALEKLFNEKVPSFSTVERRPSISRRKILLQPCFLYTYETAFDGYSDGDFENLPYQKNYGLHFL